VFCQKSLNRVGQSIKIANALGITVPLSGRADEVLE
jgi:hypothetical protein